MGVTFYRRERNMKLKDTVIIRKDDGTPLEVPGEQIDYEYHGFKFKLIVHESIQPWTPNVLDITEVTTGCRCTSTDMPASSSTKKDVIESMNLFIEDKGLRNLQARIKEMKWTY